MKQKRYLFPDFLFSEIGKQVMSFVVNNLREKSVSRSKQVPFLAINCFSIA